MKSIPAEFSRHLTSYRQQIGNLATNSRGSRLFTEELRRSITDFSDLWMSSGFKLKRLGQELEISAVRLSSWRQKLRGSSKSTRSAKGPYGFIELRSSSDSFELRFRSGAFIAGLSISDVQSLITARSS